MPAPALGAAGGGEQPFGRLAAEVLKAEAGVRELSALEQMADEIERQALGGTVEQMKDDDVEM